MKNGTAPLGPRVSCDRSLKHAAMAAAASAGRPADNVPAGPAEQIWTAVAGPDRLDQLASFPVQVGALGGVAGGGDGGVVGLLRLGAAAESAEQVGAGGVPCVVARERQPVDQGEGDFRAVQLGDRDRAVERDDR